MPESGVTRCIRKCEDGDGSGGGVAVTSEPFRVHVPTAVLRVLHKGML